MTFFLGHIRQMLSRNVKNIKQAIIMYPNECGINFVLSYSKKKFTGNSPAKYTYIHEGRDTPVQKL